MKTLRAILVGVLLLSMLVLSACGGTSNPSIGDSTNGGTEDQNQGDSQSTKEQVLVDNDVVKVTFIEIFEMPELVNTCYLRLKVENKTDKTVTVYLKETYVNDMAQMMGTGVPITLAPGKSSQQPFFFGYGNLGITSKDEIQKIELKVWLMDDNSDTVVETESLVVEFNK